MLLHRKVLSPEKRRASAMRRRLICVTDKVNYAKYDSWEGSTLNNKSRSETGMFKIKFQYEPSRHHEQPINSSFGLKFLSDHFNTLSVGLAPFLILQGYK
jgi:hypothetical protein